MSGSSKFRQWVWPGVGATPVNYGLDSEIFDSERFPHIQTFVREAIQNSLDARQDKTKPVVVRFKFHASELKGRGEFLSDLRVKKGACALRWPAEWDQGKFNWLVVEDSNSTGLNGELNKRTSDFWNYWLNFGISNKDGRGRGGRGIGRVTFLLASRINTVIGVTRRAMDGVVAACGMSVLRPMEYEDDFKCSYAYLAQETSGNVFSLYDDPTFHSELAAAFKVPDYLLKQENGFALIIPYPHESLNPKGIIAAAIEHFGPAIMGRLLVLEVDDVVVDAATIDSAAAAVKEFFSHESLKREPKRVLSLARSSLETPDFHIKVENSSKKLLDCVTAETVEQIRKSFDEKGELHISLAVPVTRDGKVTTSDVRTAISKAPAGTVPADFFFREGMCLPDVVAKNPADVDVIVQSNEGELVAYLNFCEGKAHLDLLETKEVREKLREVGFEGDVTLKRFMKKLMSDLRALVLPDTSAPDSSTFSSFFSAPMTTATKTKKKKGKKNIVIDDLPPPRVRVFLVEDLKDGFKIRSNPEYTGWPVTLRAEIAYADGSRSPMWSKHDFSLPSMQIVHSGSHKPEFSKNVVRCNDCSGAFSIEIRGFDSRRELVVNLTHTKKQEQNA